MRFLQLRSVALAAALIFAAVSRATTVVPPAFDELVDHSELVFRGSVKAVESSWRGEGAQRHIATLVTFEVEKVLKGEVPVLLTLEFMGGQVGGRRLEVTGLPRFSIGEHGVFFVEQRSARFCPLTRLRHGRYPIVNADAGGVSRVLRDDGHPLLDVTDVRAPLHESPFSDPARQAESMPLSQFEAQITRQVALAAAGKESR